MAEPELLGIGISVLANIGVALGTIVLAFFTYKSVKLSREQGELSIKMIEKPRVIEHIHNDLNGLGNELENELGEIEIRNIKWHKKNDQNNLYLLPLMFPLSEKKSFHRDIQNIFFEEKKGDKKVYSQLLNSINSNLKKRHLLYHSVNGELCTVENMILDDNFSEMVANIFLKLPGYTLNVSDSDNDDFFVTVFTIKGPIEISKSEIYDIITEMMILLIIDPSKSVKELSLYRPFYHVMIQDMHPHIVNYLNLQSIPEINHRIQEIFGDLNEIHSIDKATIEDIKSLKDSYGKNYILTKNELDPFYTN